MTASKIVAKLSNDELAAVLKDIATEHLERGKPLIPPIPSLLALEERVIKECGVSKGMAMLTAKEAALVEGCNRWLALRDACREL